MQHTLSNVRLHKDRMLIPEGKYPGSWVGTQVHFTTDGQVYVGDTKEHQQKKIDVWVRIKNGCAKVEIRQ